MQKGLRWILPVSVVAGLIFFAAPGISLAAFGVSPPFINAVHLVPGATYSQTIYLVRDDASADLPITTTLNVPDTIKSWISVSNGSDNGPNFLIPAGTQQFPVNVTITVPQNQPLGTYQGSILFATAPNSAGQVTIALGADVTMNLVVGNGVFEQFSIPYITLPSIEEGWNPRVTYRLQNDGNVSEQLTGATFSLYDQYDITQLAYLTKNDGFPIVPPFTAQEDTIQFPTDFHLGIGDYWGVVTFYKNNEAIASQKAIFHVLPRGSLSSPLDIALENIEAYWMYYLIGLIVLLLIIRRIFMVRRNKRRA